MKRNMIGTRIPVHGPMMFDDLASAHVKLPSYDHEELPLHTGYNDSAG